MFAIMIIVFGDVIMRYAFNKPFSWAYDLISLYLMAGVFFLVLSEAYTSRAHVSVDILQQKFPPAMIRLSEIVTCLVGIVVFSLIAWLGLLRAVDSFHSCRRHGRRHSVADVALDRPRAVRRRADHAAAGAASDRSCAFTRHRTRRDRAARIPRRRGNLRMILTLAMVVLFVLLAIGTPVGFAMAGSGVLGLYLIGGMPMLIGHPADRAAVGGHVV